MQKRFRDNRWKKQALGNPKKFPVANILPSVLEKRGMDRARFGEMLALLPESVVDQVPLECVAERRIEAADGQC